MIWIAVLCFVTDKETPVNFLGTGCKVSPESITTVKVAVSPLLIFMYWFDVISNNITPPQITTTCVKALNVASVSATTSDATHTPFSNLRYWPSFANDGLHWHQQLLALHAQFYCL